MPLEQSATAHWDEARLEEYVMGRLAEPEGEGLEEHLLVCAACRDGLAETEAYVRAMRSVSARLRRPESAPPLRWWPWRIAPIGAWVLAALVLTVAGALMRWGRSPGGVTPVAVYLVATRSVSASAQAAAPPGVPLRLALDVRGLAGAKWELEVVDSSGREDWRGTAAAKGETAEVLIESGLAAGQHFVRLRSASGELLREFGLRIS